MKPVQYFSEDYLQSASKATPTQIVKFLDEYRSLHGNANFQVAREPTKLISIRMGVRTLAKLKALSKQKQIPYQTLIKQMIDTGFERETLS